MSIVAPLWFELLGWLVLAVFVGLSVVWVLQRAHNRRRRP